MARSHKTRRTVHTYGTKRRKYDVNQRPGESEQKLYKRLAKAADRRLRRLEELSRQPEFKKVKKYAYAVAMRDIQTFTPGKKTFDVKPPADEQLFKEKIAAMQHFLELPTSTRAGIIEVYQKRADTINKTYGTNFSWQELADYFNKGYSDKVAKQVGGSKTALYAIGKIQRTEEDLIKGIKENTSITTEGPVDDAALALLRSNLKIPGTSHSTDTKRKARAVLSK